VTAVEKPGVHGVLHLDRRHDRAGGEDVELQSPAREGSGASRNQELSASGGCGVARGSRPHAGRLPAIRVAGIRYKTD
jgi:hypothetical protein